MSDLGRLHERVLNLQKHFGQANEDVAQILISAEKVVDTADLAGHGTLHQMRISRMMVDGVVEAAGGAHFTLCDPEYPRDEAVQRAFASSAKSPEAWADFRAAWVDIPEDEYQRKVREAAA